MTIQEANISRVLDAPILHWRNTNKQDIVEIVDGICHKEYWLPINDFRFKDDYLLSSFGRIKNARTGIIYKQWVEHTGYLKHSFRNKEYERSFYCHIVIARTFIPNPRNLPQVNHIKGNKRDNRVWRLEWTSSRDNINHSFEYRLSKKGEDHGISKLKDSQVLDIYNSKERRDYLMQKYDVSHTTIKSIKLGKTWGHVTGKKYERAENTSRKGLKNKDVIDIFLSTDKSGVLMKKYNISNVSVLNIKSRKRLSKITEGMTPGTWHK